MQIVRNLKYKAERFWDNIKHDENFPEELNQLDYFREFIISDKRGLRIKK